MTPFFQPDLLQGRVALITGGGTGICRGIAEAFAAHGCTTVLTSRKLDNLQATAQHIQATTGQPCLPVAADVRDEDQVAAAVQATLDAFGRLDIVVNGAAGNFLCPAANLSTKGLRTVMEIDAVGTWTVTRAAFDAWLKDHGGAVLNISATLHYGGTPFQLHASAAKAAIDAMTRNLAVEWGGLNIRVNGIAPGPIDDTEGMSRLAPGDLRDKIIRAIPMQRFGRIEEIANTALFLASDAAPYINGATLVVDGGAWLNAAAHLG